MAEVTNPIALGNEAAFPWVSHGGVHEHQVVEGGITKREYFAAKALQGLSANPELVHWSHEEMADHAAAAADALLVELAKN